MYFGFFKLHSWGKRSAVSRRRFNQWLPKVFAQLYMGK